VADCVNPLRRERTDVKQLYLLQNIITFVLSLVLLIKSEMTPLENILNQAMNLRPSDRALLAQKLINSLSIDEDNIEQQWLALAEKRYKELNEGSVKPKNWDEIRSGIKR
jgi:hypothetical protein